MEISLTTGEVLANKKLLIRDNAYGTEQTQMVLANDKSVRFAIETAGSFGWYDLSISMADLPGFVTLRRTGGNGETRHQ